MIHRTPSDYYTVLRAPSGALGIFPPKFVKPSTFRLAGRALSRAGANRIARVLAGR